MDRKEQVLLMVALIMALGACAPPPRSPWKEMPMIPDPPPPPPPQLIVRLAPAFKLESPAEGKTYILRRAGDEEIVTIFVNGEQERLASLAETEFLRSRLALDWTNKRLDDNLAYHYRLLEAERKRDRTLFDRAIELKKKAIAMNEERKDLIDMRVRAQEEEKVLQEETAALKKKSVDLGREIEYERAQLAILEYKRWLRDVEELKAGAPYIIETFNISDYMRRKRIKETGEVIQLIKRNVLPASWLTWYAELSFKEGHLIVRNTPEVIEAVRKYLER